MIGRAPTIAFFVTAAVVIYLLGYATQLISHNAADNDALLEFIGSIIGAAIGPGLAVMGSFWLDQRRQQGEAQHDRHVLARALDELADAITHEPTPLISDVDGKPNARQQRAQARAIIDAAADSHELMILARHGLRLGDTDLMRDLSALQRRMSECVQALQPKESDFESEAALRDHLDNAIDSAGDQLLADILHARRGLDR